jgi:hypothetical protein
VYIAPDEAPWIKPYLDLGDGLPVWRWNGTHGVHHTVRLNTPEGIVHWEVWIGETQLSDYPTFMKGRAGAEALILGWRRAGFDMRHANRALRANGYAATQHFAGPAGPGCSCAGPGCICEGCSE